MTEKQALELLHELMESTNLRRHSYAVEATMLALAERFGVDDSEKLLWGVAGLLHDADYDKYPEKHPMLIIEKLEELNVDPRIADAIKAHAWGYRDGLPEPKSNMEWALYCCDELTGFIVACALVRPEKKLSAVEVPDILKKWKQASFAKGVTRSQVEMCEEKLGISLPEFAQITLTAMRGIADDLGL